MLKTTLEEWATDEVTAEHGYVDDGRLCFWTWDDTECAWQSRPFKGRQVKRRKRKREKENTKVYPKEAEEPSRGEEQAQDSEMLSKEGL